MSAYALPVTKPSDSPDKDFLTLIVRCYDNLIEDLQEAKDAHADCRQDLVMDRLQHAQDILTELVIGLDYERGGEIAVNLGRIYNYMLRELIAVHDTQAQETLSRMISIAGNLREAWVQIANVGR